MLIKKSPASAVLIALDFDGTLFNRHKSFVPAPGSPPHSVGHISENDINAIRAVTTENKQSSRSVVSVLATGRNLLSLCKSLGVASFHHGKELQKHIPEADEHENSSLPSSKQHHENLPVDYVIVGSGSLTIKWPSQEIIRTRAMSSSIAFRIAQRLVLGDVVLPGVTSSSKTKRPFSFFILKGPPHMDASIYFLCDQDEKDPVRIQESGFAERLRTYAGSTIRVSKQDFIGDNNDGDSAEREKLFNEKYGIEGFSQFLIPFGDRSDPSIAIADELVSEAIHSDPAHGHSDDVSGRVRVSHTSSPISANAVWLEVFPSDISKSAALDALEKEVFSSASSSQNSKDKVENEPVFRLAVGNDHNDEDMLLWAAQSGVGYLVNGSPQILVERHGGKIQMLESPCGGGVAEAIMKTF